MAHCVAGVYRCCRSHCGGVQQVAVADHRWNESGNGWRAIDGRAFLGDGYVAHGRYGGRGQHRCDQLRGQSWRILWPLHHWLGAFEQRRISWADGDRCRAGDERRSGVGGREAAAGGGRRSNHVAADAFVRGRSLRPHGSAHFARWTDECVRPYVITGAPSFLALDHVMRPLAQHLGVKRIVANRLEFRDGTATGRLLEPVIRPRGALAKFSEEHPDGRRAPKTLARQLEISVEELRAAVMPSERQALTPVRPIVHFDGQTQAQGFSVRRAFAGKHVMLIGVTGFIGKVWLANTLFDLPDVERIYLLIRRQKSNPAQRRFEKMVEDSPVFDPLFDRHGDRFGDLLREKVEVVEGDVTQPGLGLAPDVARRLQKNLDLLINSSGLTDFNPDLRDALATNTDAAVNVLEFVRSSDHAGLLHLATCYVAGEQDGRVAEKLTPNYTPRGLADFDAEKEWRSLQQLVKQAEERAESEEVTSGLRTQARSKEHAAKDLHGAALENQIRKGRVRWLKTYLTEAGTRRAKELGWPNTYTLTKSLAESLIVKYGTGLPVAVVRPAIVETSVAKPFLGWNEGINTSASLSYLLGTYFRQLPSNESKRLDIIPAGER